MGLKFVLDMRLLQLMLSLIILYEQLKMSSKISIKFRLNFYWMPVALVVFCRNFLIWKVLQIFQYAVRCLVILKMGSWMILNLTEIKS